MITSTTITYEAAQAQRGDVIRNARPSRPLLRPGRVRSTGPSRRRMLARRLRLA
jgi:hypothetical protein